MNTELKSATIEFINDGQGFNCTIEGGRIEEDGERTLTEEQMKSLARAFTRMAMILWYEYDRRAAAAKEEQV